MAFNNSSELYQGLEAALVARQDALGLAFLHAMPTLGLKLQLDPTRTAFDRSTGTIFMANGTIDDYALQKNFLSAMTGLFEHEVEHYYDRFASGARFASAVEMNSRSYSKRMFYDNEADAIADQFLKGTDHGLDYGGVSNADVQLVKNELIDTFNRHDLNWTAVETALKANISYQLESIGANASSAEKYADDAQTTKTTASETSSNAVNAYFSSNEIRISDVDTIFVNEVPEFDRVDLTRTDGGGLFVNFNDRTGTSVFSASYAPPLNLLSGFSDGKGNWISWDQTLVDQTADYISNSLYQSYGVASTGDSLSFQVEQSSTGDWHVDFFARSENSQSSLLQRVSSAGQSSGMDEFLRWFQQRAESLAKDAVVFQAMPMPIEKLNMVSNDFLVTAASTEKGLAKGDEPIPPRKAVVTMSSASEVSVAASQLTQCMAQWNTSADSQAFNDAQSRDQWRTISISPNSF